MSAGRVVRGAAVPSTPVTPAHLGPEQAAVWSALLLGVREAGGRAIAAEEVLPALRAIDPAVAALPLRVELHLEALAVDGRTGVRAERPLGVGVPRYRL